MRGFVLRMGTALVAATLIVACGGGSTGNTPVKTIVKDPLKSGDAQTAVVATEPSDSLRVIVKEDDAPLPGATVTWSTSGAGAQVSPLTSQTDAAGLAATQWTLGQSAGTQVATATLSGASGSPVSFHATATPGPATNLAKVSGDAQTAIISGTFALQVRVLVTDQFGNPRSGVTVNFGGLGGVTPSAANASTGANGEAAIGVTGASSAGVGGVTAAVAGIAAPANFTLTTANAVREVTVGAGILFKSNRNNTMNPAVDTIAAGQGVLWRWAGGNHGVRGAPGFASSATSNAAGFTYTVTFPNTGTFQYDCTVHLTGMTGTVVVQ